MERNGTHSTEYGREYTAAIGCDLSMRISGNADCIIIIIADR